MAGEWQPAAPLEGLDLPGDLVTGEAVVLELRPASFATRALAFTLDLLVQIALGVALLLVLVLVATNSDAALGSAAGVTAVVALLIGVPATVETVTRGRSLGKYAAGLRVVRDDGGPIRFRHALIRGLVGLVEFYLTSFSAAVICSLANKHGKRVGDVLAGTYVVRERSGTIPEPVIMPPELATWAQGADIGRIPDRLAYLARQFLNRTPTLHLGSRQRLGLELGTEVARHVAPPPPAGVHPERFLAAVLAERRRRDLNRLARELAERDARAARRHAASALSPASTRLIGEE